MGLKASFAIAAALIICPVVALIGYKHWLDTRTFEPLDMPISLSRGHIRTPDFYINLTGEYQAEIYANDLPTTNTSCWGEAWGSLQTHVVAYENVLKIGEADSSSGGYIAVLRAP